MKNYAKKEIMDLVNQSCNGSKYRILQADNEDVLKDLQVDTNSTLGCILMHFSSMNVGGYLRILSIENKKEDSDIVFFNGRLREANPCKKLFIANDIWGGLYAISNGDFDGDDNNIWYYAPDALAWEDVGMNYDQFLFWACSDKLVGFYRDFLWRDMDQYLQKINMNQGVLIYPFLWSHECNIETADKKIVPLEELLGINADCERILHNRTE